MYRTAMYKHFLSAEFTQTIKFYWNPRIFGSILRYIWNTVCGWLDCLNCLISGNLRTPGTSCRATHGAPCSLPPPAPAHYVWVDTGRSNTRYLIYFFYIKVIWSRWAMGGSSFLLLGNSCCYKQTNNGSRLDLTWKCSYLILDGIFFYINRTNFFFKRLV